MEAVIGRGIRGAIRARYRARAHFNSTFNIAALARSQARGIVRSVKWRRVRCCSLHCASVRLFLFRHPLTARILARS